ncbi:MAG: amidase, partial [Flavobacteriales bacterium]|nr:amidase [Flavobacteriales bacterium]
GSIRVPAAMCGIVGLKTTVGKIDVSGMSPLSPTYDSIGTLTRSVNDALLVYGALQDEPIDCGKRVEKLKIGLCENIFFDEIELEVKNAVLDAANTLASLGTEICSLKLQEVDIIYDQIKETSLIATEAYPLHKKIIENSSMDWVTNWLKVASNYSVEQVVHSQKKIKELSFQLDIRTKNIDAIIVPTTPIVAKLVSSCDSYESHAKISSLISRNTQIGNMVGWCGIALPCGISQNGLPISLLIYTGANNEHTAFSIAKSLEQALLMKLGSLKPPYIFN